MKKFINNQTSKIHLNDYKNFLPKSSFWKNVFTLALGTGIAQLIPIMISPILTDLYSPEDFGVYGLYFSCTMVLSVIICGRYEMAILLPEKDEDRINLLMLCVIIAVFITVFLFIMIYFWGDWFAVMLKNDSIKRLLIFIPLLWILCWLKKQGWNQ